jgi:hypothetical protein
VREKETERENQTRERKRRMDKRLKITWHEMKRDIQTAMHSENHFSTMDNNKLGGNNVESEWVYITYPLLGVLQTVEV